ncbi:MAG TPA: methyltransferase domain-containing protein [Vicinamibacteria bacterium]|nr:methyltransferase domain-containing protein [Vicinamibacteria bacterium]
MIVLNLGCGIRTSPRCVNVDWSLYLALRRSRLLTALAGRVLDAPRRQHLARIDGATVLHDLRRPLPFPDQWADAVYHSHVLEHFDRHLEDPDRDAALGFLRENLRVLKPGGILRVVVPDLEALCRGYLDDLAACAAQAAPGAEHDRAVARILEQSVRREAATTARRRGLRRRVERLVLGDARRRGETHQWMYDRVNLAALLERAGFAEVRVVGYGVSRIPEWNEIALDLDEGGRERRPSSLYLEAVRPAARAQASAPGAARPGP